MGRIAAWKANDAARVAGEDKSWAIGSVVASDAFFPFPDGLLAAAEAGATAIIQPGGSMHDDEVIAAADDAGLESGDVIVEINGMEIKNISNLQEQVAINRPGDKILVTFIRDGKTKTVNATLKNTLGTTEVVASTNSFTIDGAVFADVPKELREKLEIEGGAQVSEIGNGKWKSSGITKGFIVTSINKRNISDVEDLSTTLSQLPKDDGVLVEGVYPNGVKAYYGIGW